MDLKLFLTTRMFDLYFQAPWICACHELSILEALFYYGTRLFSYRNYLGSVMHTYNILREMNRIEPISLLDSLCKTFDDILFPGGRPRLRFKACWIRYMGGRLRYNPHNADHKSGCHSMAIPAHTAKATAGFGSQDEAKDLKYDPEKISMTYHAKARGYHLDDATWDRISDLDHDKSILPLASKSVSSRHRRRQSRSSSCDYRQRLRWLEEAMQKEFNGPFPIAKLNLFKVYVACVRIVAVISDRWHGDQVRPGQYCLCFMDTLLPAADRYLDNDYRQWRMACTQELVGICRDAIEDALGGRAMDEFLWEYV